MQDTRTLPDGTQLKGRWVMAEATAPTPSHDPHTLQSSPGFPTTAQGRNVNDNDYSQKGALVRSMAANYDGRAIDNPVFVKDGVVISGNNRTMSGAIAAENNTDAKYLQALQQRAQSLGFTNEQVASFEHPRVFFEVTDDVPMTTETFAKFNQRESKSKTPTERAIVASKRDNSRLVGLILSELDKYETLQEAYQNANTNAAIIRYMVDTGLINQNEVPELYEDGLFTAAGKDFLESLLVGSVIEEDQIKALNTEGMKPLRSKVVKSIIPLTENSKLREENRILADINKAISYLYAAKRAGMSLNELVRQNNMFETQIWDEPAVFVALKLQEKEKEFKNFVEQVNARLSSETPNMFTGELETKQDIYGEYEQQLSAEQQSTLEAARESNRIARGINTQTETVPGNGAGYVSSGQRTDGVLKEPQQEAERIISLMEQNAVQAPDIELSQENWVKQFGEHGKISTPLGVVKIGDNQYAKIKTLNRDDQWGMILPTLTDPDIIIEERSIAKDGQTTERSSSYIYVKTFIKSGQKVKYFASVSVLKDGLEVIISNHYVERKALKNKLENDRILYLKKELISNSSDRHLAENQNGLPDLLPTQENSSVSDSKANELSSEKQTASSQDSSQTIYEKAQNSVLNKKISAQAAKTDTNPTEKQKQAGNYKMGHVKVFGLDISIENPAGSIRSGKDADGNTWQTRINNHYGYIKGTKGKDKDHIDVFLGDNVATGKVYVVDQINPDGSFDEHKVMLGFDSIEQAKAAYLSNYEQGWQGLGNITEVPVDQFKSWIANNSRKIKPFSEYKTEAIEQVKQAVEQYSKKYGVPVEVVESSQQVQNPTARAAIRRVEQTGRGKVFGWFEPKTGKVQIYAPSVAFSLNELEKTILHEVVAHKGLRSLLGDEKFNELCDEVFANMDDYIKLSFGAYVLGKPENELTQADRVAILNNKPLQREIADELMASFAERGVNEHPSLWEKVKQLVKKALKSIGVNINMTDADIAYLLYRSSKALQENTILEKANNRQQTQQVKTNLSDKNIARQMGFDTGLSSGDQQGNAAETRLRYVERVNDKFNEDLQSQIDGTLPAGYVYQLGTPSDILLSSGLPYLPIELAASRLADKSMQQNHPFDLSELTGLVDAIQNPLAVFRSATHLGSYVVLTEIQHKGKNYVVAIQTNKNKGRIRINDNRSIHYRTSNSHIANWINEGLLEYVDKRRMPEWISKQQYNSAEVRNLFRHAAKVVNDFENPNIPQGNDEITRFRKVYHGTKADFDKFDHSHMGEGEGVQAYGWGSYVTEVEGIGRAYAVARRDEAISKKHQENAIINKLARETLSSNNGNASAALKYLYSLLNEDWSDKKRVKSQIKIIETGRFLPETKVRAHLYEVEIPDDNGTNYLYWEKEIPDEVIDNLQEALDVTIKHGLKGYKLYDDLRQVLGSARAASEFLSDVGFTGISYPAESRTGGRADGARNYVIFKEEDLDIVEHTRFRYTTSSGKNVNFTQLSLFDNKQEDEQLLLGRKLRPLQDGEFSHVERVFTETGAFSFMGSETVESADDVAYIFSQLEDESIENGFAVLVKDKKPYVLHVGMGAFSQTYFNIPAIVAADNLIKADAVYMVHNHPSGNLMASIADMRALADLRNALGSKVQDGIIINLKTGKYGVFNTEDRKPYGIKADIANEYPIKVYSFNKQVFEHDFAPDKLFSIRSSEDVAGFVSSYRLGDRGKIGMLILNSGNKVVGNIFTQYASMDNLNADDVKNFAKEVVDYTLKMGGVASIIYGSGVNLDSVNGQSNVRAVSSAVNRLSAKGLSIIDWVSVEGNAQKYASAIDEGIRFRHDYTPEMQQIKERTIADGTFMKAPNGNPTNLNERQWLQTRTQSFKNWFGDWEKPARIQKLKESEPVKITGQEIEYSSNIKQYKLNALNYGKSIRNNYVNEDTNVKVEVNAESIKEVLHHDYKNIEHLQSIAAIPQLITKGIYISTLLNETPTNNTKVKEYQYYVCGLKIGKEDYTVKFVLAVDNNGNRYYDHKLTEIEKNKLLNELDRITSPSSQEENVLSAVKDKRLLSILQTNSSKVVDENGEPRVVYHGSNYRPLLSNGKFIASDGAYGKGIYFTSAFPEAADYAREKLDNQDLSEDEIYDNGYITEAFLNITDKEKIFPSSYGSGENIYLVDNSSQIKSATDNIGDFSSENDDIRFKRDNSLVGLHNISEEKGLEGVLGKQGYDNLLKDLLIHLRVISLPYIFFWAVIFLMAHFLFL